MSSKKRPLDVVVLLSGGMDSVTALHDAASRHRVVLGLSFNYGAKHNARELPFAAHHCRELRVPHRVVRLPFVDALFRSALLKSGGEIPDGGYRKSNLRQTVVPFRNGVLLAVAAGVAESMGARGLVIAAHRGDHAIYPDCRERFMAAMADAVRLGTYARIRLLRPFIALSKAEIAARGAELGVDFSKTWSCYRGGRLHCGRCGTCVERQEAFRKSGVPDPTRYDTPAS
jgi:7-cyano-7-deazaguanine synthase